MKPLSELTDKEIVDLTQDEIERYVKLAYMEAGFSTPQEPDVHEVPEVPSPTDPYFKVNVEHHLEILVKTKEEADSLRSALASVVTYKADYDYPWDSKIKYGKKISGEAVTVSEVMLYSPVEYADAKRISQEASDAKKHNDAEEKRFKEENEAIAECREEVLDAVSAARGRVSKHDRVISIWNEYLEAAGGDQDIAKRFLDKNQRITATDVQAACEYYPESNLGRYVFALTAPESATA